MVGVPGGGAVGHRLVGLVRRQVVERRPLEQHPTGGDVHLLDAVVEHPPAGAAAVHAEVGRARLVDQQQRGVARRDDEVVEVHRPVVAGLHARHLPVAAVDDDALPDAHADVLVDAALPPGQHGPPAVLLHLEGGGVLSLGHLRRARRAGRAGPTIIGPVSPYRALPCVTK